MSQFERTALLLGEDAIQALAQKRVAVFGLGGVGSWCCEALGRAGVGQLALIDHDTVSESNINRQLVALHSTIGLPKAAVMASHLITRWLFLCLTRKCAEAFFICRKTPI